MLSRLPLRFARPAAQAGYAARTPRAVFGMAIRMNSTAAPVDGSKGRKMPAMPKRSFAPANKVDATFTIRVCILGSSLAGTCSPPFTYAC